jgi:hypothetical protein
VKATPGQEARTQIVRIVYILASDETQDFVGQRIDRRWPRYCAVIFHGREKAARSSSDGQTIVFSSRRALSLKKVVFVAAMEQRRDERADREEEMAKKNKSCRGLLP